MMLYKKGIVLFPFSPRNTSIGYILLLGYGCVIFREMNVMVMYGIELSARFLTLGRISGYRSAAFRSVGSRIGLHEVICGIDAFCDMANLVDCLKNNRIYEVPLSEFIDFSPIFTP